MKSLDKSFTDLPLQALAEAAISEATTLGASWVDFRIQKDDTYELFFRDAKQESEYDASSIGLGVRVLVGSSFGFAFDPELTFEGAQRAAKAAIALAHTVSILNQGPAQFTTEPTLPTQSYISEYEIDPFEVPASQKANFLKKYSRRLLDLGMDQATGYLTFLKTHKYYADSSGASLTSKKIITDVSFEATIKAADGDFISLKTLACPTARGFEYLTDPVSNWDAQIEELPELLRAKVKAEEITPGEYDLLIAPSNLWLVIHESIAHATESDRVLGYEANYAGTSFVRPEDIGTLSYGSPALNVQAEKSAAHGLATTPFDDEGVATHSFEIIKDGILVNLQTDKSSAAIAGQAHSNGCAFAETATSTPLQRMPNVNILPDENGPDLEQMIKSIKKGLLVKGDNSWSIDMQRKNFQFTAQLFFLIQDGVVVGQVKNAAYQSTTPHFWHSIKAVGNQSTYEVGAANNCGKAQPGQAAPVSHGTPAIVFNSINVINTKMEQL